MANLQALPKDILVLLPDYLHTIEDYTHLSATCTKLRESMHTALPNTILRLAAAQSKIFFRPSPHLLVAATARQLGDWARQSDANEAELALQCQEGVDGLLSLALEHCGLTMERIRELHKMRFDIVNPVTNIIDQCVGTQWYAQPDFWNTVDDAYTIDSDPPETFFHLAIYGELFAPDFESILDKDTSARRLQVSTRIEFAKYCIPDWAVTCHQEWDDPGRKVNPVGPYHPDNSIRANHNIALTWVIRSKHWTPHWKAMRAKVGSDFQEDFDDGWWTFEEGDRDWRQRLWEDIMICQGLEGFEMIRPEMQDKWIVKVRGWREKIEQLGAEPPAVTIGRQSTLEYPYLLGDLRICVSGYVSGT